MSTLFVLVFLKQFYVMLLQLGLPLLLFDSLEVVLVLFINQLILSISLLINQLLFYFESSLMAPFVDDPAERGLRLQSHR